MRARMLMARARAHTGTRVLVGIVGNCDARLFQSDSSLYVSCFHSHLSQRILHPENAASRAFESLPLSPPQLARGATSLRFDANLAEHPADTYVEVRLKRHGLRIVRVKQVRLVGERAAGTPRVHVRARCFVHAQTRDPAAGSVHGARALAPRRARQVYGDG